ncbi:hypothetical protein [Apilactobacillus apinorum]|uniref:hypothetical protein n=1 Tax=Apilactobacillus apinorum TaxID=1218495 RepID=UPI0006B57F99|nr:hypothetical protein [Apilactobacillus apinorum]KOY68992.1 hypothetical protein RZ74_07920 [Apilactobacillus apinorum]CAI2679120.1 Hypothetical protein AAPFHON13_08420 [Apilactobacillus apinorum]
MKDVQMDNSGDIVIDNESGDISMISSDSELEQHIYSLLNTFVGELSWNEELGLNQMQLLASANDKNAIQSILNDYLRSNLTNFDTLKVIDMNQQNRNIQINAEIKMINGQSIKTTLGGD